MAAMATLATLTRHALVSSLPNILAIFLAVGLLCSLYPLREHAGRHLAVAALACLGLSFLSAYVHSGVAPWIDTALGGNASSLCTFVIFVLVILVCLPLSALVFELAPWDALFCCTTGYALQNFAHSLWEVISVSAGLSEAFGNGELALLQLALTAAVLAIFYLTVISNIRTNHLEGESDGRTAVILVLVILLNIALDIVIRSMSNSGMVAGGAYLLMRLMHMIACALLLALDYSILYGNRMRADAAATRQLMVAEQQQYQLSQRTIDAINVRCHDIRHQVRNLSGPDGSGREFLEGISDLISVYDTEVHTSNKALDIILTEKSVLCQSKGIGLTCEVNGEALSFMEEQDVYSLFGNALDNAIEASEAVADPERRLIDVSTRQAGNMVSVQVRNFYDGELRLVDGVPQTTKTDGGLHGYGMKSLRLVTERYGGTLTFDADGGIFRLSALLPAPE